MNPTAVWIFFRCLRWLLWIAAVVYSIMCMANPVAYMDSFGRLYHATEFWLYSLPSAAVFAGFFEMMWREKAGFVRPAFLRDWTGRAPDASAA